MIPDHLGIDAETGSSGEESIVKVFFEPVRLRGSVLAIRSGHHNGFLQGLHVPTVSDKLGGEPIEQFRMRRRFPLTSKILARFDNSRSEESFPKTIDSHARGEWIFRIH